MTTSDEKYMARCLQLARLAINHTAPNPMVGAVIVHNNLIIGEGYHRRYGEPHAEPMAILSVKNQNLLPESTLYVNLEPCSHFGKTPPCANLIIEKRIKHVVIGAPDPNPKVAGRGIKLLREAGIEVTIGVLEHAARQLNKRFYCFHENKRPYITIKWAQTADGFIDTCRNSAKEHALAISNATTSQLTHKMRAENMAIMVSTNTVLMDNPSLTVRFWSGRNPIRIILDRNGRIPSHFNVKDGKTLSYIFTDKSEVSTDNLNYIKLENDYYDLNSVFRKLFELKIHSVLVEGGAKLLTSIIRAGMWDEANIEVSPLKIGEGVTAPTLVNAEKEYALNYDGQQWKHYKHINNRSME